MCRREWEKQHNKLSNWEEWRRDTNPAGINSTLLCTSLNAFCCFSRAEKQQDTSKNLIKHMTEYTRDDRFNERVSFYLDKGIIFSFVCVSSKESGEVAKHPSVRAASLRCAAAPAMAPSHLQNPDSTEAGGILSPTHFFCSCRELTPCLTQSYFIKP